MRDRRRSPLEWILFDFQEEVKGLIAAEMKTAHICSAPRRVLVWENHFSTSKYYLEHLRNVHGVMSFLQVWIAGFSNKVRSKWRGSEDSDHLTCRSWHAQEQFSLYFAFYHLKSLKKWLFRNGFYMC